MKWQWHTETKVLREKPTSVTFPTINPTWNCLEWNLSLQGGLMTNHINHGMHTYDKEVQQSNLRTGCLCWGKGQAGVRQNTAPCTPPRILVQKCRQHLSNKCNPNMMFSTEVQCCRHHSGMTLAVNTWCWLLLCTLSGSTASKLSDHRSLLWGSSKCAHHKRIPKCVSSDMFYTTQCTCFMHIALTETPIFY